ncbi:class I adenylate-forming enzyme family protein [Streptomyces genisteinicus]|uniref:AMP-binding protein n=1 Tax=Streptomyces genisteinicus TaxID=2768068 RepID=A0A7H0HTM1_9ACTN|nr:AMP-binding protein [Streptomyces genisteinicus]QNP63887.1 AMP-binding protein [Streptomyces genisteinicus]
MTDARTAADPRPFVSYAEQILDTLAHEPGRPAVTAVDGRRLTAGAFLAATCRLARWLTGRGIGPGQTVCLLTGNTPEALYARYAANLAGARVVHLYERLPAGTLAHIVESVGPRLLLADSTRGGDLDRLLPLVRVPEAGTLGPGRHGDDVVAASAGLDASPFPSPAGPDDDWCIRHTGGTTGVPKGLQMRHGPYLRSLDHLREPAGPPPRHLVSTPLSHVAGLCCDLAFLDGGSVVLQRSFEPGEVLRAVERERITHLWLLPPLLHQLLDHPALPTTDVSSLRRVTYGGSPASAARLRQAAEVLGPVLHGWYGQTETLGLTEVHADEHEVTGRHGQITVGRPMPGVEIVVRDDRGEAVAAGTEGEIHARTPAMMSGYWKQPELTDRVLRDGWVRTGDVGYLDDRGYLFLTDRGTDLLTLAGRQVSPREIEELLLTHPGVARCAVVGVHDKEAVQRIHAVVVTAPGHRLTADELHTFVADRKGGDHAPHSVRFAGTIPLTAVGKPDRNLLRRQLR